jgi:RNA polymerase sigma-70 factor (ECF subfamily)
MKIRYKFATGEVSEIEVSEELGIELATMAHTQANRKRAETRRHQSLEALIEEGHTLPNEYDLAAAVEHLMLHEQLFVALASLQPQQRELLCKVFVEKISLAQIARDEGVQYQAIQSRVRWIILKIKKML